jgi:hypothetical protein
MELKLRVEAEEVQLEKQWVEFVEVVYVNYI